ncbi:Syntaxin-1A, partial [Orchesella cincta]
MARNNTGNGEVVIELGGRDNDFERFLAEVTEVKTTIQKLVSNVEKVKSLHDKILSSLSTDEQLKSDLDDLMSVIRTSSQNIRTQLKEMKISQENDSLTSTTLRVRSTQHSSLQQNFVDVMHQYQFAQIEYRDKCKARINRQLEITGSNATDEDVKDMLEKGNLSVFTQWIFMETKQAKERLEDVEARHKEILMLEQSLQDLHELFIEMALLVESQGEVVNTIEMHVASGQNYADKAVDELKMAKKLQTKARKKKIWFATAVIVPNHGVGVAIDCDENDLISVVSQIAATFSNITVAFRAAERTPVKLSVAFRQCENGTVLGFKNAFEKATEANNIYPGTVSIIYIEYLEGKVEELLSCLVTAKKSLKNTDIELGAAVPFEDCFEMELAMVLKHVRNLAFTMLFQSKSNNTYIQPIVVVKEVWHMFAQCENRLKKYGKSISSVELRSGWHNFNLPSRFHEQVGTHEENLITFWERMGEYAEKYNRKLVLMEAFDDPNKVGFHFNKSGWWRLVQRI